LALIGTYNTKHNDPYKLAHGYPGFSKQEIMYKEITHNDMGKLPNFELMCE